MARIHSLDPRVPNLNQNAVRCVGGQILEADGDAAGVYTLDVRIPAYATVLDVIVHNEALWDAGTSATLNVGMYTVDSTTKAISSEEDLDGIFAAIDVKATDLTAGQAISFWRAGGKGGAMLTEGSSSHLLNIMQPTERILRAAITTVGTVGTAGKTYAYVVYALPEMDSATFTAS